MTKVSFASMKLKVDTNVNTFDFEYNGATYSIDVLKYLPISEKNDLIEVALQKAEQNGNYNDVALEMYFNLNLIYLYTNIAFTDKQKEDESELYDKLQCSGLIDAVITNMDQDEYSQLLEYLEKTKENRLVYGNSAAAVLRSFIQDLPSQMSQAVDILNNIKPEQFEEARRLAQIADKTGMNNPSKVIQMPTPEK